MDDTTYKLALERELEHAQKIKPGGQEPRPEHIKAIKDELARLAGSKRGKTKADGMETASATVENPVAS